MSRLSVPSTSHRHFTSLCRRLGRIFAHAYFHHREVFEQAEAESSLYARFLALVKYFDLVPLEFLVIPPRMEGRAEPVEPPRLMGAALEPRRDSVTVLRPKSPPGPAGAARDGSPRKFGRARTDTMVYSEAFSVAEELAKGDLSEVDIDREIAVERAASVPGVSEPFVPPMLVGPQGAVETESVIVPPPASGPAEEEEEEVIPPMMEEPEDEDATESVQEGSSLVVAPAVETPSEEPANAPEEAPTVPPTEEAAPAPVTEPTAPPAQEADAPVEAEPAAPAEAEPEAPVAKEDAKEDVEPETNEAAPETNEAAPETEEVAAAEEETETSEEVVAETVPEPAPATEEAVSEPPAEEAADPVEAAKPKEESEEIAETPSYAAVAAATAESDESESPQADISIEEESEVEQLTDAAKELEAPAAES